MARRIFASTACSTDIKLVIKLVFIAAILALGCMDM
jgi:hypothetical protein